MNWGSLGVIISYFINTVLFECMYPLSFILLNSGCEQHEAWQFVGANLKTVVNGRGQRHPGITPMGKYEIPVHPHLYAVLNRPGEWVKESEYSIDLAVLWVLPAHMTWRSGLLSGG